nr:unnamed protein product [Ipomoea batatas]
MRSLRPRHSLPLLQEQRRLALAPEAKAETLFKPWLLERRRLASTLECGDGIEGDGGDRIEGDDAAFSSVFSFSGNLGTLLLFNGAASPTIPSLRACSIAFSVPSNSTPTNSTSSSNKEGTAAFGLEPYTHEVVLLESGEVEASFGGDSPLDVELGGGGIGLSPKGSSFSDVSKRKKSISPDAAAFPSWAFKPTPLTELIPVNPLKMLSTLELVLPSVKPLLSGNSSSAPTTTSSSLLLLPPLGAPFRLISSIKSEAEVLIGAPPILSSWKANQFEFVNKLLQKGLTCHTQLL